MMRMTSTLAFVCAAFVAACSWGEGSPDDEQGGGVDAAVTSAVCGDGVCAASEANSCSSDCGSGGGSVQPTCGNNMCETGETSASCPNDCGGGGGGGGGSGSAACPSDPLACIGCLLDPTACPAGLDANTCAQCALGGGGGLPGGGGGLPGGNCPNGVCDPGEDANTCPFDCM